MRSRPDSTAAFLARQRAEREAAGLPAAITDAATLRVIAALVARPIGGAR